MNTQRESCGPISLTPLSGPVGAGGRGGSSQLCNPGGEDGRVRSCHGLSAMQRMVLFLLSPRHIGTQMKPSGSEGGPRRGQGEEGHRRTHWHWSTLLSQTCPFSLQAASASRADAASTAAKSVAQTVMVPTRWLRLGALQGLFVCVAK